MIFFYGVTGCPSWKSVMPGYVSGLTISAHVFVLNKRFVPDRSTGLFDCGNDFYLSNNPDQWVADSLGFITTQVRSATPKPENVVFVGVSAGALPATKIAADPRSIEKDWYGNPCRWWADIVDIDTLPDFLQLTIPILIGTGWQDESVPVESVLFLESKSRRLVKAILL